MSRIVLSIDNGNRCQEEAKNYLSSHDCKVYTLSGKARQPKACIAGCPKEYAWLEGEDIQGLLAEIERNEGRIDLLLFGIDERIPEDSFIGNHDCEELLEVLGEQINHTEYIIGAALPLLRKGNLKRIGMITKKDSSVSYCKDDRNYGRHMVWAGLNMVGKLYFNMLRPEGFTFRWYCAEDNAGGMSAGEYLLKGLCYDPNEPYIHSDENRFVMRDSYLREIPW